MSILFCLYLHAFVIIILLLHIFICEANFEKKKKTSTDYESFENSSFHDVYYILYKYCSPQTNYY